MDINIRALTIEDWPEVSAIYSHAINDGHFTFTDSCPTYEEWDSAHVKDCRYVITVDGTVAGWCALSPISPRKPYAGVSEVSIYVREDHRHQGIGTKLLNYLCRESPKLGYWSLYSIVFSTNTASIKLHEKCGFRRIGYREKIAKDVFGNWTDIFTYEKRSDLY